MLTKEHKVAWKAVSMELCEHHDTEDEYFLSYIIRGDEVQVKVRVKLSLRFLTEHHAMDVYWGSGGIAPLIL
jgi:hypothetical protein